MSNVGSLFEFIEEPKKKGKESRQKNNQYIQSVLTTCGLLREKKNNNSIVRLSCGTDPKQRKPFAYKTQIRQLKKEKVFESIGKSTKLFVDDQMVANIQSKTKLTIDQSLMRALHQVRAEQKEKNNEQMTMRKHQKSIQRKGLALSKIKMVPFKSWELESNSSSKKRTKGIKIRLDNENREALTKERRVQYQACLFWAKKHKKDQSFYEKQLSKGKSQNEVFQITQRKNFKFTVKKKHSGVKVYSQNGTLPLLEKAGSENSREKELWGQQQELNAKFMQRQNVQFTNGNSVNKLVLYQRSKTTMK